VRYYKLFRQRINLFFHGIQKGVSVAWISKSQEEVVTSIEDLMKIHPKLNFDSLKNLNSAKKSYNSAITQNSGKVSSANWDAEPNLCILIYLCILKYKPKIVIETGVANGITTRVIMAALEKTGGALHSFDILSASSKVYSGKGDWNFHLLHPRKCRKELLEVVADIGSPALWIHDSNHGSAWQEFEYRLAMKSLEGGGALISDDIDASTAWGELSKDLFTKAYAIFDNRKMIGITFKDN